MDGIEIDHPSNSPEDRAECITLCEQYGLIRTGGTDFHGANHKRSIRSAPASRRTTRSPGSRNLHTNGKNSIIKKLKKKERMYRNEQIV